MRSTLQAVLAGSPVAVMLTEAFSLGATHQNDVGDDASKTMRPSPDTISDIDDSFSSKACPSSATEKPEPPFMIFTVPVHGVDEVFVSVTTTSPSTGRVPGVCFVSEMDDPVPEPRLIVLESCVAGNAVWQVTWIESAPWKTRSSTEITTRSSSMRLSSYLR